MRTSKEMAEEIKKEAKMAKVKLWEIADRLGVQDGTFSRKLRHITEAERDLIFCIISDIKKERLTNDAD